MDDFDKAMKQAEDPAPLTVEVRESSRRYVYTKYWADDGRYAPYDNMLRDPRTDKEATQATFLAELFEAAGVSDGDEVEIVVRKTGRRPFGDRQVRLVKPHEYEREPVDEAFDPVSGQTFPYERPGK